MTLTQITLICMTAIIKLQNGAEAYTMFNCREADKPPVIVYSQNNVFRKKGEGE